MGHEVTCLAHQVDAQVLVFNPDVYVLTANEQAISQRLKVSGQEVISLLVGVLLIVPMGEGVGR